MLSWFKFNGLGVFLISNAILFGGITGFFLNRLDGSKIPIESILGAPTSGKFLSPIAFLQDEAHFIQLAHAPSNSKISLFILPTPREVPSDYFASLRKYQPNAKNPLDDRVITFLRAQFDPRRAEIQDSLSVQGITWHRLLVKNKHHYLVSLFNAPAGHVAVVAFNPRIPIPEEAIEDMFNNFIALNQSGATS
jgi:hypothetical protein